MTSERRHVTTRAVAAVQLGTGVAGILAPHRLLRLFGMDPTRLTGEGLLAWRLFGIRQIVVGAGNARRVPAAAQGSVAIGALEIGLFTTTLRSGAVPRRTSVMALATALAVALASLRSQSRS